MRHRVPLVVSLIVLHSAAAEVSAFAEELQKIGTWNMHWLGRVDENGEDLENIDGAASYADYIHKSGARVLGLQEIVPSHTSGEKDYVRCFYLDHIQRELNELGGDWTYVIDSVNGNQRLAFLWDKEKWKLESLRVPYPGDAFAGRMRQPFVGVFQSKVGELKLQLVNLHLKAMPDGWARRREQVHQLATWLRDHGGEIDKDVVLLGDLNLYHSEMTYNPLKPLTDRAYRELKDEENTNIYKGQSQQRFDRFIVSKEVWPEVQSARAVAGAQDLVDAHTVPPSGYYEFVGTRSDHFLVTMQIDVSEER